MVRTIFLAVAATMAASGMAFADTYYTLSNPRIIHVPQPGDDVRKSHASLSRVAPDHFDDEDAATPPRPHRAAKPQPRSVTRQQPKAVTPTEPVRRKPFSVSLPEPPPPEPEPAGPKRALLSAPPPMPTSSIHDGPTPLKPTPRFGQPLPEPPAPLTTFTPPPAPVAALKPPPQPAPESSAASASAPAFVATALPADENDDHLPPPGDPRLAPPEPRD